MKKIVVINGSPRINWNTATLVKEASQGAKQAGAEIQHFDLYRLEKFTGCISCFGCKTLASLGKCVCRDGLKPVLEAIREADGLIIGTPNYLGDVSAAFRALFERLIFQSLTYKKEFRSYNQKSIPVLFIMTSNAPDSSYTEGGYGDMIERYRQSLNTFVGNTKVMICGNTLQVNDYTPYGWTMFDPESKQERRKEVFPIECAKAREFGREMITQGW